MAPLRPWLWAKTVPSGATSVTVTVPWTLGGMTEVQSIMSGSPLAGVGGMVVMVVLGLDTGERKHEHCLKEMMWVLAYPEQSLSEYVSLKVIYTCTIRCLQWTKGQR